MNRIQQILEKAEKDETVRRAVSLDTLESQRFATSAPYAPAPAPGHGRDSNDGARRAADGATATRIDESERDPAAPLMPDSSRAPAPTGKVTLHPLLVAGLAPSSPAAEQYRSLRSRITQMAQSPRVIQITSPGHHDGKTVTALNLALTMAQEFQRRVLVIDTDLRRPSVHQLLGLPPGPGLVDLLTGRVPLGDALIELPEHHLTVLRAGASYDHPAEMLGSAPMRRLMDSLRTEFDRIVIDSAPTLVSDPGAVAALADGLVLVVRAGVTTKPSISKAVSTLGGARVLGMVFNESTTTQPTYAARH
jgi:protein-tyrosine kinase